jgi:hypothetical protein
VTQAKGIVRPPPKATRSNKRITEEEIAERRKALDEKINVSTPSLLLYLRV